MNMEEPPSARFHSKPPLFFVGTNSRGHWVVQDEQHLIGGLFISRAAALRFALFENSNNPQAVIMVPDLFEIDLKDAPMIGHQSAEQIDAAPMRRAA
jgi:hypothetical protein